VNRTLLIFRHEFAHTIRKVGFIILTLALPVLALATIGASRLVTGVAQPPAKTITIGYVDELGDFGGFADQGDITFVRLDTADTATQALVRGDVDEYIVIPPDYVAFGVISRYTLEKELAPPPATAAAIQRFLSSNLLAGSVPTDVASRVQSPLLAVTTTLTPTGAVAVDQGGYGNFVVPAVFSVLLCLALVVTSNYVLQSLSEEKENRLMEILLSSVSTRQLLAGKLLGRGVAGLLQVSIWVLSIPLLLKLASSTIGGFASAIQLPPGFLVIGVIYFVLGYSLFAVLSLAVAAVASSVREAQGLAPIFTMFAIAPFWFVSLLMLFPDSSVWVVFSFVPFSAPVLVMLRLGLTNVPAWQVAASMAVLAASVIGGLLLAAKLLRIYLLMYGKRPRLRDIARSVRAR
jgi:ABC-2 type transport system permease protein